MIFCNKDKTKLLFSNNLIGLFLQDTNIACKDIRGEYHILFSYTDTIKAKENYEKLMYEITEYYYQLHPRKDDVLIKTYEV